MLLNFVYSKPVKILLWFRKGKKDPKLGTICCRLGLDGKRLEISTGLTIDKRRWDADRQKAIGNENQYINNQLENLSKAIREFEKDAPDHAMPRLRYIRDRVMGKDNRKPTYDLNWLIDNYLEIKIPENCDLEKSTQANIRAKLNIIRKYNKAQDQGEMLVADFKPILARKCYQWIRDRDYSHNTAVKVCQIFKEAFRYAMEEDVIRTNPFDRLKQSEVAGTLEFLAKEELHRLENHTFEKKELRHATDLFLLMCYTGMNISDLPKLKPEHFYLDGGRYWLKYVRKKSARNKPALIGNIPIFPEVIRLLEKYDNQIKVHTGQALNRTLKLVEDDLFIPVHLTTKLGRKTCGHMLINEMGLSVDAASSILGNSIRTFLKNYANIRQQRIAMELDKLG